MSIYILLEYVEECKVRDIIPTFEGLKAFKQMWLN